MMYAEPTKATKCLLTTKFLQLVKTRPQKLPERTLPAIFTLLLALTALAESQMGLKRNWSFVESPPGAPGESDLRFSGLEYIYLSSLITENSCNSKVNSLGVI